MVGFHEALVGRLLAEAEPVKRIKSPLSQWLLWLALSCFSVVLFLTAIHLQDMGAVFHNMPSLGFLLIAFLGSALSAWEAVSSSVPGRQTGSAYRLLSVTLLVALLFMPFLFFAPGRGSFDLVSCCASGWPCIQWGSVAGFFPWLTLGFLISRNASFRPFWTGAWAGLSAFLLGTFTIQLHCPSWETGHMFVAHLLPVALLTFPASFIGAFWFSRWKK